MFKGEEGERYQSLTVFYVLTYSLLLFRHIMCVSRTSECFGVGLRVCEVQYRSQPSS